MLKILIRRLGAYLMAVLRPRSGVSSRRLVLLLTLFHFFGIQWFSLIFRRYVQEDFLLYSIIVILGALGVVSVDSLRGLFEAKKLPLSVNAKGNIDENRPN